MNDMTSINEVASVLRGYRFNLVDEKRLQGEILAVLGRHFGVLAEYWLGRDSVVDFMVDGVAVEIKIKGSRREIYRQVERYCGFDQVKSIVLVTNRAMGLPSEINGKDTCVVNLGKAWL